MAPVELRGHPSGRDHYRQGTIGRPWRGPEGNGRAGVGQWAHFEHQADIGVRRTGATLAAWTARIAAWLAGGRRVIVFFDNDAQRLVAKLVGDPG